MPTLDSVHSGLFKQIVPLLTLHANARCQLPACSAAPSRTTRQGACQEPKDMHGHGIVTRML